MARKKLPPEEKTPFAPRGAEHVADLVAQGVPYPRLNPDGSEFLSDEPIVLRVKRRTLTDLETLRHQIRQIRATEGPLEFETFADADDFDLEDDFGDFTSQWEIPVDNQVDAYVAARTTGELPDSSQQAAPAEGTPPSGTPDPIRENPAS